MTEQLHFHFSLSCTGEGTGNPLQCSCLENLRDEEAWWAAICGVTLSWTQLKQLSSNTYQTQWMWVWVNSGSWWGTGRPGVLQFMGSQRVGHDWATELNWTKFFWALGSITVNKANGDDGVRLFQILKDDAVKVPANSTCQQIWKTQQWPQDWKRFSFQSQRKAVPKNVQTSAQLHSSHMLAK